MDVGWRSVVAALLSAAWLATPVAVRADGAGAPHEEHPAMAVHVGRVGGTIVDAVSSTPVPAATVTVTRRVLRRHGRGPEGAAGSRSKVVSLAPLTAGADTVASARTDDAGRFAVDVAFTSDQPYVKLGVSAPGYRPAGVVLHRLTAHTDASGPSTPAAVTLSLVPLDLDPEHELQLQHEQALARARMYARIEPAAPDHAGRATSGGRARVGSGGTYPVPDEVFVVDLPGSFFTGFMDFDEYVAGVVAAEMGDTFPFEALKVQAVASRTFALERFERSNVASGGQAYSAFFSELGESHIAARNTSGGVLLYDAAPITAFFSARCNGDRTLDSEDGLSCIPNGCANPCTVGGLLPGADPLPYARTRPCSGHVDCSLTTEACCTVLADGRTQHIFGHGVGMCQRGAQELACRDGVRFADILAGYYTDVTLANDPGVGVGARVATTTGLNARAAPCDADRVVVPAGTPGTLVAAARIAHCPQLGSCVGSGGTYWTWWQVDFDDGTTGRWVVEDFLELLAPPATATVAISGVIADEETGLPVASVGIACEPDAGSDASDAAGRYTVLAPLGWTGICVPSAAGYRFLPSERGYAALDADRSGDDYTARSTCARPASGAASPQVSDCLVILRAAVGIAACEPACICAPGGSLPPSAGDALVCLGRSVGLDLPMHCPCESP